MTTIDGVGSGRPSASRAAVCRTVRARAHVPLRDQRPPRHRPCRRSAARQSPPIGTHRVRERVPFLGWAPGRVRHSCCGNSHRAEPEPAALCALSVATGTMQFVPKTTTPKRETAEQPPLVSHTGVPLTRSVTFRFTLAPTRAQHQQLLAHAGASRLAFNHQVGRVKANLDQRAAERSYLAFRTSGTRFSSPILRLVRRCGR